MYFWVVVLRNHGPSGQIYQGGISRKPDCIRENFRIIVMVCVALSAVPAAADNFLTVSYAHTGTLTNSPVIYRVVFCVQLILSFSPHILGVNFSRLCT